MILKNDYACMINFASFIYIDEEEDQLGALSLCARLKYWQHHNQRDIWSVIVIHENSYYDLTQSWEELDFCGNYFNASDFRQCGVILAEHMDMLDTIEPLPF